MTIFYSAAWIVVMSMAAPEPAPVAVPKNNMVIPAAIYRDNLIAHMPDASRKGAPYVLVTQPLDRSVRYIQPLSTSYDRPRNGFEAVFFRGPTLVIGRNSYIRSKNASVDPPRSIDDITCVSPKHLIEGRWSHVEPNGDLIKEQSSFGTPSLWARLTDLVFETQLPPRETPLFHTAYAADGERGLLVFDLLVPQERGTNEVPRIQVGRIVPNEKTPAVGVEGPKLQLLVEISAAFDEPFQAYLVGDEYYFLTKSGSVYRSPLPEKGQPRTMVVAWDIKKQRPVQFIISDGNKPGVHYLLYRQKDSSAWDYFTFERKPTPKLLVKNGPDADEEPFDALCRLAWQMRQNKIILTPPERK